MICIHIYDMICMHENVMLCLLWYKTWPTTELLHLWM